MFAWIQQLLGIESVETAEEASSKLRRRMQRETEGLLNYELSRYGRYSAADSPFAAVHSCTRQMDGAGEA